MLFNCYKVSTLETIINWFDVIYLCLILMNIKIVPWISIKMLSNVFDLNGQPGAASTQFKIDLVCLSSWHSINMILNRDHKHYNDVKVKEYHKDFHLSHNLYNLESFLQVKSFNHNLRLSDILRLFHNFIVYSGKGIIYSITIFLQ